MFNMSTKCMKSLKQSIKLCDDSVVDYTDSINKV